MLYTRKGDAGTSGLFGTKVRFPKDSPIYHALGTLDELNSLLGLCHARSASVGSRESAPISEYVRTVQKHIFIVQAELAGAEKELTQQHVDQLEAMIEQLENLIANPHSFVIPGANELSALFDYARAVSRRAERAVVGAAGIRRVSASTAAYLNRLSSLLYVLARHTAVREGSMETAPAY